MLDNRTIWTILRTVTFGGPAWNWVQSFERQQDGRGAFNSFTAHYLGNSYTERIRMRADQTLQRAFFDGKSRNFTFETYCELLNTAFTDLETSGEEVSESRKVRIFIQGLKDHRLDVAKSQILASDTLKSTFQAAVTFTATYLSDFSSIDSNTNPRTRNISQFTRGANQGRGARTGRGRGGRGGRGRGRGGSSNRSQRNSTNSSNNANSSHNLPINADRTYTNHEWHNVLTNDERSQVRRLRRERDEASTIQRTIATLRAMQEQDSGSTITSIQIPTTAAAPTPAPATAAPSTRNVSTLMSRRSQS